MLKLLLKETQLLQAELRLEGNKLLLCKQMAIFL